MLDASGPQWRCGLQLQAEFIGHSEVAISESTQKRKSGYAAEGSRHRRSADCAYVSIET
jgi:hypothetical protein